jgi:predicted PurR-regulated permease PerM
VTICLVLIVPLGFAAVEVGREGQAAVEWLRRAQENGIAEPGWLERIPIIGNRAVQWWRGHLSRPQQAGDLLSSFDTAALANWAKAFGTELLHRGFVFFVTMLALFFLLRDGEWLSRRLLDHADRVLGDPGDRLAKRMVLATRGTFNGTVLVAVGEGSPAPQLTETSRKQTASARGMIHGGTHDGAAGRRGATARVWRSSARPRRCSHGEPCASFLAPGPHGEPA